MSIDWSDISKLRFRDFDAKITEVYVSKTEIENNEPDPIKVWYIHKGKVMYSDYSINGNYWQNSPNDKDILQTREEPFSFLEIVELIGKGAEFADTNYANAMRVINIDLVNQKFICRDYDDDEYSFTLDYFLGNMHYSFDGFNYSKLYKEIK